MNPIISQITRLGAELDNRERTNNPISVEHRRKMLEMVRVTTQSGNELVMTPETVFALKHIGGSPVLRSTYPDKPLRRLQFLPFEKGDDRASELWFIAGLVFSAGKITEDTRSAIFTLPRERRDLALQIFDFACFYQTAHDVRGRAGASAVIEFFEVGKMVSVQSQVIDHMLNQLVNIRRDHAERLAVQWPDFYDFHLLHNADLTEAYTLAFLAGVLAGGDLDNDGRVVTHTNSHAIRKLQQMFRSVGVPVESRINPHEPAILTQKRRVKPHSLVLHRRHYLKVQMAGIVYNDKDLLFGGGTQAGLHEYGDPIVKVEPAGKHNQIILRGKGEAIVNGFVLNLEFEPNETAMEIAAMDELFAEVADPKEIIARSPAHMTHVHGELK